MQDNKKTFKVLINQPNNSYEEFVKEIVKNFQPDLDVEFFNYAKELNKLDMRSLSKMKFDLLVFTGGEDVSPDYYNEIKGKYTSTNVKRDALESDMFHLFKNVPKLGICRGLK